MKKKYIGFRDYESTKCVKSLLYLGDNVPLCVCSVNLLLHWFIDKSVLVLSNWHPAEAMTPNTQAARRSKAFWVHTLSVCERRHFLPGKPLQQCVHHWTYTVSVLGVHTEIAKLNLKEVFPQTRDNSCVCLCPCVCVCVSLVGTKCCSSQIWRHFEAQNVVYRVGVTIGRGLCRCVSG